MSQRHPHRKSREFGREGVGAASQGESRVERRWAESRRSSDYPPRTSLTRLIEQDAPLLNHSQLVLMYGPFQAEMQPEVGQGVASWLKDCLRKHGIPSLVRFDYRRRAQVFRRDQFQPWFDELMKAS